MKTLKIHKWNLSPKEAIKLQIALKDKLDLKSSLKISHIGLIAACDVAYFKQQNLCVAAIVVCEFKSMKIVEQSTIRIHSQFPYIPGLLSFREIPPLIEATERLKTEPDVFVLDGQGIAHPRRLGLASHFGLLVDKPSIGCAKSRLIGNYDPLNYKKGSKSFLYINNEKVGIVLRSRDGCNPIFISPGHKINIQSSLNIIKHCLTKYRIPDILRYAHHLSNK